MLNKTRQDDSPEKSSNYFSEKAGEDLDDDMLS